MRRRTLVAIAVPLALAAGCAAFLSRVHAGFADDETPQASYTRIAFAMNEGKPRDAFAYLETRAQWASYTIRDYRRKSVERVSAAYPEPERSRLVAAWKPDGDAPDGADVWARLASERGFIGRLRRDLSGVASVEIAGERATVVTVRGTRYPFRQRENGIWGLAMFTGELLAEEEKAARDWEVVSRAADDYARAAAGPR